MGQLLAEFERYNESLDSDLEKDLSQHEGLLYEMMRYQLGWVDLQGLPLPKPSDPRVTPLLCLLSCEVLCSDYRPALPVASGIQLIQTFIEVHEDVQGGAPKRDETPSVWWVWGPGQAINVGDALYSLGRAALLRLTKSGVDDGKVLRALKTLDNACINMFEGQHMDLVFQERIDLSVEQYLTMVERKTGALMACAMELGALLATDDESVIQAFRLCGSKLGIAFQIQQDIIDLWADPAQSGSNPGIFNKKKTFPIVQLFDAGEVKVKRQLGTIYFKRVLEQTDMESVLTLLEESNSREVAHSTAEAYLSEAIKILDDVDLDSSGRQRLVDIGRYIISRSR